MNKIKKISIIFLFLFFLSSPLVFSQSKNTTLEEPVGPGTSAQNPLVKCGGDNNPCTVNDMFILMQSILNLVFIFAGFIAATMFMYAGFLLITAAGNSGQIQKAKDIFRRVVIGFLIMFLSYIIVKNLLTSIKAEEFFKNLIN